MNQYAKVYHAEPWGPRERKYAALFATDITTSQWTELTPTSPYYFFVPRDERRRREYERGWKITDIMPVNIPLPPTPIPRLMLHEP